VWGGKEIEAERRGRGGEWRKEGEGRGTVKRNKRGERGWGRGAQVASKVAAMERNLTQRRIIKQDELLGLTALSKREKHNVFRSRKRKSFGGPGGVVARLKEKKRCQILMFVRCRRPKAGKRLLHGELPCLREELGTAAE